MKKYLSVLTALTLFFSCTNPGNEGSNIKAVDLGLSVKWASCNLGASSPEDYGDYYAWGEVKTKRNYEVKTYKWGEWSVLTGSFSKYNTEESYGEVDNKTVLDPEDDVAHIKLGGNWRMPTIAEQEELRNKCTWRWTQIDGVNGYKVTGPSGNSIFLPAAGYRDEDGFNRAGVNGYYWSLSLHPDYPSFAWSFGFTSSRIGWNIFRRCNGHSVRPVTE